MRILAWNERERRRGVGGANLLSVVENPWMVVGRTKASRKEFVALMQQNTELVTQITVYSKYLKVRQ